MRLMSRPNMSMVHLSETVNWKENYRKLYNRRTFLLHKFSFKYYHTFTILRILKLVSQYYILQLAFTLLTKVLLTSYLANRHATTCHLVSGRAIPWYL